MILAALLFLSSEILISLHALTSFYEVCTISNSSIKNSDVAMDGNRIIAICQSGGEFESNADGILSYKGGDAHAMEIDEKMKFKDFKLEVAEMFNCNLGTLAIKYFLPGNKKTLISISNDKDLKRMIKFHNDSDSAEIYVMTDEISAPDVSHMPGSR